MKKKIEKRLNGFQSLHRKRHIHALKLSMTDSEYRLWDLLVSLADWDNGHEEFGTVFATDRDLASLIGCNRTKIWRTRHSLEEKAVIIKVDKSHYWIGVGMNIDGSPMNTESSYLQQSQPQNTVVPLVSFKDNSYESSALSDSELERISREIDSLY